MWKGYVGISEGEMFVRAEKMEGSSIFSGKSDIIVAIIMNRLYLFVPGYNYVSIWLHKCTQSVWTTLW